MDLVPELPVFLRVVTEVATQTADVVTYVPNPLQEGNFELCVAQGPRRFDIEINVIVIPRQHIVPVTQERECDLSSFRAVHGNIFLKDECESWSGLRRLSKRPQVVQCSVEGVVKLLDSKF